MQIFAASGEGYTGVETDEVDASVMYHKSITGAVQMTINDIKVRGANLESHDLFMILPGYGRVTDQGTLCDLLGSTYIMNNPSPYTITIRVQRPMGFKDDVNSLAMWEPLGSKLIYEIPPRGELRLGSSNGATSHMAPRELTKLGKRCVHLISFSVFREPMTDVGNTPGADLLKSEVGLVIEAVTRYKCMNGDVGLTDGYLVETFSGSNRLNHVNVGPLVDLRFSDINIAGGPVVAVKFEEKGDRMGILFSADGKNFVGDSDLDVKTIYRISTPIPMQDNLSKKNGIAVYIGYVKSGSSLGYWTPGFLDGEDLSFKAGLIVKDAYRPDALPVDEWLRPVVARQGGKSSVSFRRRGGATCIQHNSVKIRGHQNLTALDDSLVETVLKGLVVIYEVTKVAVEILGVVGVLANPDLKNSEVLAGRG